MMNMATQTHRPYKVNEAMREIKQSTLLLNFFLAKTNALSSIPPCGQVNENHAVPGVPKFDQQVWRV